jgi:hypothetical protein
MGPKVSHDGRDNVFPRGLGGQAEGGASIDSEEEQDAQDHGRGRKDGKTTALTR